MNEFEFYTKNNNYIELKENKLFNTILLLVFASLTIYFIYTGAMANEDIPFWIFSLLPTGIFTYKVSRKVRFHLDTSVLEISFLKILSQKYKSKKFDNFLVVSHKF